MGDPISSMYCDLAFSAIYETTADRRYQSLAYSGFVVHEGHKALLAIF
jgi:hypothetical protein